MGGGEGVGEPSVKPLYSNYVLEAVVKSRKERIDAAPLRGWRRWNPNITLLLVRREEDRT